MAKWIKVSGTIEEVAPENGTDFQLEELYRYTNGGPIEIVQCRIEDGMLVINEEGKLLDLPFNAEATRLYGNRYDHLVGDALHCKNGEVQ